MQLEWHRLLIQRKLSRHVGGRIVFKNMMKTFVSAHGLFQIQLPTGWQHSFEQNVYTFQYEESSALQISPMFHPGRKQFVLDEELEKEQKKHPTAHITELSEYGAVHYGIDMVDEKMLQYVWITGYKNVKLLCTLTTSSEQDNQKLDADYEKAVEILNALRISPPQ
jgi:hypothetical protein